MPLRLPSRTSPASIPRNPLSMTPSTSNLSERRTRPCAVLPSVLPYTPSASIRALLLMGDAPHGRCHRLVITSACVPSPRKRSDSRTDADAGRASIPSSSLRSLE